ncbi:helix-turn-helix domain-containing protein [Halomarina ordinaria]|uniref:Helix-turn-helix domain-containing protein n=1 Tax=Halomarina ordinaria TaxID=3033939 RepID=A0ABD5UGQ6_9EURY|nr:helix-turn-helix domain-containing protein [Halomarina sp. PSRA2]
MPSDNALSEPMIATFVLQQPTLMQALAAVPSTRLTWEQTDATDCGETFVLFWAASDDYDAFEAAMADDPTVRDPRHLTTFDGRRLYRVEQVDAGKERSVYPALVETGAIVQELTATHEGWCFQVLFPDHEALSRFHRACVDRDVAFRLLNKFEQVGEPDAGYDFGLSEKQRRMLVRAAEAGYYRVPRRVDLSTVADEVGISHQAASERLRRAVDRLVRHTVLPDGDGPTDGGPPRR